MIPDNSEAILYGSDPNQPDPPSLDTSQDQQRLSSLLQYIKGIDANSINLGQPQTQFDPRIIQSSSPTSFTADTRPLDQRPGFNPLMARGTIGGSFDPLSSVRQHAQLLQSKIEEDKIADNFKKIILGKLVKGELKQDAQGNYQEIQQLPDELGQLKPQWAPVSLPTASMLQHIKGLNAINITDQKDVNSAVALRVLNQKGATPVISPPSESQPASDVTKGLFGALQDYSQGRNQEDYQQSLEPKANIYPVQTVGNLLRNVGTSITGGRYVPLDQGTPSIRDDRGERQMIDVLRSRKGLGPISDLMWQEFLQNRGQGANRPILSQ